jgi:hypothetical protein
VCVCKHTDVHNRVVFLTRWWWKFREIQTFALKWDEIVHCSQTVVESNVPTARVELQVVNAPRSEKVSVLLVVPIAPSVAAARPGTVSGICREEGRGSAHTEFSGGG